MWWRGCTEVRNVSFDTFQAQETAPCYKLTPQNTAVSVPKKATALVELSGVRHYLGVHGFPEIIIRRNLSPRDQSGVHKRQGIELAIRIYCVTMLRRVFALISKSRFCISRSATLAARADMTQVDAQVTRGRSLWVVPEQHADGSHF